MTQPVRVPNVSPGARSGLDHEVIGANAQEAYDANQALDGAGSGPQVPEDATTVTALLDWAASAETPEEERARAEAVLAAEQAKPEDKQRSTLIEALEGYLADEDENGEETDAEEGDGPGVPGDAPEGSTGQDDAPSGTDDSTPSA